MESIHSNGSDLSGRAPWRREDSADVAGVDLGPLCSFCSTPLAHDASFCHDCGAKASLDDHDSDDIGWRPSRRSAGSDENTQNRLAELLLENSALHDRVHDLEKMKMRSTDTEDVPAALSFHGGPMAPKHTLRVKSCLSIMSNGAEEAERSLVARRRWTWAIMQVRLIQAKATIKELARSCEESSRSAEACQGESARLAEQLAETERLLREANDRLEHQREQYSLELDVHISERENMQKALQAMQDARTPDTTGQGNNLMAELMTGMDRLRSGSGRLGQLHFSRAVSMRQAVTFDRTFSIDESKVLEGAKLNAMFAKESSIGPEEPLAAEKLQSIQQSAHAQESMLEQLPGAVVPESVCAALAPPSTAVVAEHEARPQPPAAARPELELRVMSLESLRASGQLESWASGLEEEVETKRSTGLAFDEAGPPTAQLRRLIGEIEVSVAANGWSTVECGKFEQMRELFVALDCQLSDALRRVSALELEAGRGNGPQDDAARLEAADLWEVVADLRRQLGNMRKERNHFREQSQRGWFDGILDDSVTYWLCASDSKHRRD